MNFDGVQEFGRCFVMRDSVRPVQDENWPHLMERRKVNGRGLKAHSWRKAASPLFVFACLMDPLAS